MFHNSLVYNSDTLANLNLLFLVFHFVFVFEQSSLKAALCVLPDQLTRGTLSLSGGDTRAVPAIVFEIDSRAFCRGRQATDQQA